MSRCLSCGCEAEVHRAMRTGAHVYIYCTDCAGKGVRPTATSMTGPYETYCYAVGDPGAGLWGGTYFEASRAVAKWPPEMRAVPIPPTYEEAMAARHKASRCAGCGKPESKNHSLGVWGCYGKCKAAHVPHPNSVAVRGDRDEWRWAKACYDKAHPGDLPP